MDYLENDSSYLKTSKHLIGSWEWGLNYASAQAYDDIEVICCGIVVPIYGGGYGVGIGDGGGGSNDASDNAGGNGGDSDERPDSEEERRIAECIRDAKQEHNQCLALAGGATAITVGICTGFINPIFIAACSAVASVGGIIGAYECNAMLIDAEHNCRY